jgi:DNA repair protein RecO (recombination protein O)
MGTLQQVESAGPALPLQGRRLVSGLYANELLMRVLGREDPHPGLFENYVRLIDALAANEPEAPALRTFERDLLGMLGYGLSLSADRQGHRLVPEQRYRYDPLNGAIPVTDSQTSGVVMIGQHLINLAKDPMSAETAKATRALMRAALAPHLGGRPLKTRELYARYPVQGDNDDGPPSGQS